jgi:hypothetical protein
MARLLDLCGATVRDTCDIEKQEECETRLTTAADFLFRQESGISFELVVIFS